MNLWECDEHGCGMRAHGVGGAAGLRAIGWHFVPGSRLLCPFHRPDRVPCQDRPEEPCTQCAGEAQAELLLAAIEHAPVLLQACKDAVAMLEPAARGLMQQCGRAAVETLWREVETLARKIDRAERAGVLHVLRADRL